MIHVNKQTSRYVE